MYIIFKYAKSHIYELHAFLAGSLAFLLMFPVKKPMKIWISHFTNRMAAVNPRWNENRIIYQRRMGLSLIALDLMMSAAIFWMLSMISPMISCSVKTMLLSGTLSLTIYALYDQVFKKRKGED